jgi:hypothetical protein
VALPDSQPLNSNIITHISRLKNRVLWLITSPITRWRIKRYLKQLSKMREGNRWWENMVGFPAKIDSYHSEDLAAIYLRTKRTGRGKGEDLIDGTEVKSVNTPSTIDTQRFTMFNGINSTDPVKRANSRTLFCKFMDNTPRHVYVIIDHPPPIGNQIESWVDRLRVRIYVIQNQNDPIYRQYLIDGLAKRNLSKIQIHIDDSNRSNGLYLQKRLNGEDLVADLSEPEVFTSTAGAIIFPKVFEAIEVNRASGRWDIIRQDYPCQSLRCLAGPHYRLSTPNNESNPWSRINLLRYCDTLGISNGDFSLSEFHELLAPYFTEEKIANMSRLEMKSNCQRLEIPSITDMGMKRFLGARKSTRRPFETGTGIDQRAIQLHRLNLAGHPAMSWPGIHNLFIERGMEEEE